MRRFKRKSNLSTEWLDKKYINLLSTQLQGFKWKSSDLANVRCPLCGDSNSNTKKKRGYFYLKAGHYVYYCHNECGTVSIKDLLYRLNAQLFNAYRMELLVSRGQKDPVHQTNIAVKYGTNQFLPDLRKLQKISQLGINHPAKLYVQKRKIPTPYHSVFRWCPNFMTWTNTIKPDKFEEKILVHDEGRILIPFFDEKNEFFAYLGRAISSNDVRYILIVLDHDKPLLYGLNTADFDKKVWAVEGPIDSIFLNNCIALAGSNFLSLTSYQKSHIVIAYDNEPRSSTTKTKIIHAVEQGFPVVIWPNWVEFKDINKMVESGWTSEYIEGLMDSNTFSGIEAKIRVEQWSRR